MRAKHDTLLGLRMKHRHDILSIDAHSVEELGSEILNDDRVGKLIQLSREPIGTIGMGLGGRDTWPETGLLGNKLVGRIGIKSRNNNRFLGFFGGICGLLRLLVATRDQK